MGNRFCLPEVLHANVPPEHRSGCRDDVRMMVLDGEEVRHTQFHELGSFLHEGDVLVFNDSRTLPAELKGVTEKGEKMVIRLARRISDKKWAVIVAEGVAESGKTIWFSKSLCALIGKNAGAYDHLSFSKGGTELLNDIYQIGEPIRYEYIHEPWPLEVYQTVYSSAPGSVEMASAGRAFTCKMLFELEALGVNLVYLTLHTGISDLLQENWSPNPYENWEEYTIPKKTAHTVNKAIKEGRRVIAVGTTVVRALESAFDTEVNSGKGWTNLYIRSQTKLQAVHGLLTGFHEPEASHLDMLSAFVSKEKLDKAYEIAIQEKYLWHEFGDVNLILGVSK
ncbi:S-adenosylmethionine:tRNA ribosyltransferase-isomerase [Bacillus sp. RAR_GA_16]|uniref:S-adenosylmethionine:tRNA ribosyltransferase-isomerase n=1 Tax=Bacillus sp. RAR_GA_16 TaxID=2876774 RepID=UPI001CCA1566|nr:S-adenosylmethionine:tRNA ribosyltransferase-isomerase [Bacillus sp. RAR_GA_16]MCA0173774.1 S-adenosylmethionine:tRNA ribosyltransferase-isomerase [Bacillus sp. RAR_GA_16]